MINKINTSKTVVMSKVISALPNSAAVSVWIPTGPEKRTCNPSSSSSPSVTSRPIFSLMISSNLSSEACNYFVDASSSKNTCVFNASPSTEALSANAAGVMSPNGGINVWYIIGESSNSIYNCLIASISSVLSTPCLFHTSSNGLPTSSENSLFSISVATSELASSGNNWLEVVS